MVMTFRRAVLLRVWLLARDLHHAYFYMFAFIRNVLATNRGPNRQDATHKQHHMLMTHSEGMYSTTSDGQFLNAIVSSCPFFLVIVRLL